ncbi:MAG: hypothetical protein WB615_14205 [Candidatus Tumulicola sp.]
MNIARGPISLTLLLSSTLAFTACGAQSQFAPVTGSDAATTARTVADSTIDCGGQPMGQLGNQGPKMAHPHFQKKTGTAKGSQPAADFRLAVSNATANAAEIFNRRYDQIGKFTGGLNGPSGEAYDGHGNLFVANSDAFNVEEYPDDGIMPSFTYSAGLDSSERPTDVATDAGGNVYVASTTAEVCSGRGSVIEYAPHQNAAMLKCTLGAAVGVAVDKAGDVFVSETTGIDSARIVEFIGGLHGCLRSTLSAAIASPGAIRLGNDGVLFAVNRVNGAIDVIAPPYDKLTTLASGFVNPTAVALDSRETRLFVADYGAGKVWVFAYPGGELLRTLGSEHGIAAPRGLATFPKATYP